MNYYLYWQRYYLGCVPDTRIQEYNLSVDKLEITLDYYNTFLLPTKVAREKAAEVFHTKRRLLRVCARCGGLNAFIKYEDKYLCEVCSKKICHCGASLDAYGTCTNNTHIESSVYGYSFKPFPVFYGKADWFYGFEFEVAGRDKYIGAKLANRIMFSPFKHWYAKWDSSVDVEIVTHPMSYNYIFKNWEHKIHPIFEYARNMDFKSWEGGKAGAHIHVSRTIGKLNIYKILYFFWQTQHWEFLRVLSGREALDNYYCNFVNMKPWFKSPRRWLKFNNQHSHRYVPLNLESPHTLEFRLFRGSLNENRVKMYFQFVAALIHWCFETSLQNITVKSFINFCKEHHFQYKILYSFLFNDSVMQITTNAYLQGD